MTNKYIYLSHFIDHKTTVYGNKTKPVISRLSSIADGDIANNTHFSSTLHVGTHIDLPYHFHENGQTIENFTPDFWIFLHPLIIEIKKPELVIKDQLEEKIIHAASNGNKDIDILIIKTFSSDKRGESSFWEKNIGFHPDLYDCIKKQLPNVRVLGTDSISISSFAERALGRAAHKKFLNPEAPILLLEDMNLSSIKSETSFENIIISPLPVRKADGLPCSVLGKLEKG